MATESERILIVDDEEILRWTLSRKLSREGYICGEAGNGEEALNTMKEKPSDLVILDINMPGKPGTEILPEIRAVFPQTGVIMASGVTDPRVIVQCIWDGAHDYLCKPYRPDDVLASVQAALAKRKLEAGIREYQQRLHDTAKMQGSQIRGLFHDAIRTLISALEANDHTTAGHSQRVTEMTVTLGAGIGLAEDDLEDIRWSALLHDVGKIAVDRRILNKAGRLTPGEYRHIMTHAVIGPSIIKPLVNERVVQNISHHHDHFDGSGLDQVITGDAIPLGARILAVTDAYDAMTSDRPYRAAMSHEDALKEIIRCSGSQFDPNLAGAFLEIMKTDKRRLSVQAVSAVNAMTTSIE